MKPRHFDHAVLPVSSLENARDRYTALGFTVATDSKHPFGTENACVFFDDGTYLEPLGIDQREECEASATAGNVFTKLDQTYRFRVGEDGFSAIAFKTDNAAGDDKQFKALAISAGQQLSFARKLTDMNGREVKIEFKLSFARDDRAPDTTLFTCQRVNMPQIDISSMTKHTNGVKGIKEIVLSEFVPSDFQYFLQPVLRNRDTPSHSFGMEIAADNVNISVLTPEGMNAIFGIKRATMERGLRCEGIVFTVSDSARLEKHLVDNNINAKKVGRYLVVPPARGQGAFFAFDFS